MNRRLTGTRYALAAPLSNDRHSHPTAFQQKPRQSAFESATARINEDMGQIRIGVPSVVPAQRPVKRTHLEDNNRNARVKVPLVVPARRPVHRHCTGAPSANGGWDPCGTRKTPFRWFLPGQGPPSAEEPATETEMTKRTHLSVSNQPIWQNLGEIGRRVEACLDHDCPERYDYDETNPFPLRTTIMTKRTHLIDLPKPVWSASGGWDVLRPNTLWVPIRRGGWDPCGKRKTSFRWFLPAEGG